jgi:uncharacterized protein (TIGR00251 family)
MIASSEREGVLEFAVRVVPRSSRTGITGEHNGALRVRVTSPPVDGAANEELVRVLARAFHVPLRHVVIASGLASKLKQVLIRGATREQLDRLAKGD